VDGAVNRNRKGSRPLSARSDSVEAAARKKSRPPLAAEGKVVTRDELRQALWQEDTFVDFELGVNTAVKKLRQALEDSAEAAPGISI